MRLLPARRGRKRLLIVVLVPGLVLLLFISLVAQSQLGDGEKPPEGRTAPMPPLPPDQRLVLTYFFYWYDSQTGGHLQEETLSNHPPPEPAPNWRNPAWFEKELLDMAYAGIDVVLPVYWGFGEEEWSSQGLPVLAAAWDQLSQRGEAVPAIGMFFDTTIIRGRDLTTADGKEFFYANIKDFFSRIPRHQWALINGRPIVWLFTSDWTAAMDQSTFDFVYEHFATDFGVRPYIVREVSWDYPILGWKGKVSEGERIWDYEHPIRTENSYLWAAAQNGFVDRGGVAAVGPGFDDRPVRGPHRLVRPRDDGRWYGENFEVAITSGKPLLAIETWNELHEASGISETEEFGRQYIEITRQYADQFKALVAAEDG